MQNDTPKLHCPNDLCQAPNSQADKFCQQCGTLMLKRYLWAVGEKIPLLTAGELWFDRYLLIEDRLFLDTKPGLLPEIFVAELPEQTKHYLRLVSYRPHVPQVYALVPAEEGNAPIMLLEQAAIYPDVLPQAGQLLPRLTDVWNEATSMRQLSWLWQIAQLWGPLESEELAATLLEPNLLRVEGSLVRLLELSPTQEPVPLAALGQFWLAWVVGAKPAIAKFLEQLCQALVNGEVNSPDQLITLLDLALVDLRRSQVATIQLTTLTDSGPSRQRNEDACYPVSGTFTTNPATVAATVIVCDGIGGHEGGNVASHLAIETIQAQLQQLLHDDPASTPAAISNKLEQVIYEANDQISQRNDSEHRYGRQRMGTTLVMSLAWEHEIYIAHVGDSRAYWITRHSCHQITLDDDVASREVRLGYSLYQEALQQPAAGSLVQALGMSSLNTSLHPTIERFLLNEDCVLLLCSDGLSDYDRIEQCWATEILPVLDRQVDLATACQRLVTIANTQNGHDNVTVGLIYCQVQFLEPTEAILPDLVRISTTNLSSPPAQSLAAVNKSVPTEPTNLSTLQTQIIPSPSYRRKLLLPKLLGIILLFGVGGGLLAYFLIPAISHLINANPSQTSSTTPFPVATPVPTSSVSLTPGERLLVQHSTSARPVLVYLESAPPFPQQTPSGYISQGTVLQITASKNAAIQVMPDPNCFQTSKNLHQNSTTANGNSRNEFLPSAPSTYNPVKLGRKGGWIRLLDAQAHLQAGAIKLLQPGECTILTPTAASSDAISSNSFNFSNS